jgi:hypothetical protein
MAKDEKKKVKGCPHMDMQPCAGPECVAWHEWHVSPGHRLVKGCKAFGVEEKDIFKE